MKHRFDFTFDLDRIPSRKEIDSFIETFNATQSIFDFKVGKKKVENIKISRPKYGQPTSDNAP
jgi:hypothetical protein